MNTRVLSNVVLGLFAIVLVGVIAVSLHAGVSATRIVIDATSGASNSLSPRSRAVLESLGARTIVPTSSAASDTLWRVVLSTNLSPADETRFAMTRVRDVLSVLARDDRVQVTEIDTSSQSSLRDAEKLLTDLVERDAESITDLTDQLARSVQDALTLVRDASTSIDEMPAIGTETRLDLEADTRAATDDLERAVEAINSASERVVTGVVVPDFDEMREQAAAAWSRVSRLADRFERTGGQANDTASTLRDSAQVALNQIQESVPPIVGGVASALSEDEALLVIGPPGRRALAIEMWRLLPTDTTGQVLHADAGRRAEHLVVSAIATLQSDRRPIVVFTHAEPAPVLDTAPILDALRDELSVRGVALTEWATALQATAPPEVLAADGADVVYLVAGTNAAAASTERSASGAERAGRLATVTSDLIENGSAVLYSLPPSSLPSLGAPDPMAQILEPLGIVARTDSPLLVESRESGRRVVLAEIRAPSAPIEPSHPINSAISGLPLRLPWALPLQIVTNQTTADAAGWSLSPVVALETDDTVWGEAEWFGYASVPEAQRGMLADAPQPGGPDDLSADQWTLAIACERERDGSSQRVLVVGCNRWFFDQVARGGARVGSRVVLEAPGNTELLESSLAWLMQRDELIPRGPTARWVSRVRPIDPGSLMTLRWVVTLGLPSLILIVATFVGLTRRG